MRRIFAANISILEFRQLARGERCISHWHFIVYCLLLKRKIANIYLLVSFHVKVHSTRFTTCNVYLAEIFLSRDSRRSFKFLFSILQIWFTCTKRSTFYLTVKVLTE